MKTLKKVFFYLCLLLAVVLTALTLTAILFKDKIINQFIAAANSHINTPVTIGKIDISVFQDFPRMSIVLTDVYIEDSEKGSYPLLTAKGLAFELNPIEVWRGNYTIRGLTVTDCEANLKVNATGDNNYSVFKDNATTGGGGAVHFALTNVKLEHTRFRYLNLTLQAELIFKSETLLASIESLNKVYNVSAEGELTTEKISIDGSTFLNGKSFSIKSELSYDETNMLVSVKPSAVALQNSNFIAAGNYGWKKKAVVDFSVSAQDANIQTILSLLPASIYTAVAKYKSEGDVYFNAKLKGQIGGARSPSLSIDFGFKNATIFHPDYKTKFEDTSLQGSFTTDAISDARRAALVLKNIGGKLNDEPFEANFIVENFKDPEIICDFKGRIDAASLQEVYPVENLKDVEGSFLADVSLEGKIELLKNKATAQRVSTRGTIELEDVSLNYGAEGFPVNHLKGSLQFSNNDLALSNVSAQLGNSDILLNGFFKNVITFLLFEDQPIGIETDLKSTYLDVDQLFAVAFGKPSEGSKQEYEFSISRNVNLNFNCDIRGMKYKRFTARDLKGDLLVKNEVAVSRNISMKTMGGNLIAAGIVDAKNKKAVDVVCSFKLDGIHADSVFYVFENFGQDFIQEQHLKGQAVADVSLEMTLNQNLKLFSETLIADIGFSIKNGELNNFEPMKKLNKYLDDEGLNKLRFSELKNDIHIEKKTIFIPPMDIHTNVTDLKVSGTHTFDQQIEYHIMTPLQNKKKHQAQEAQNAIDDDGSGRPKLFLKIVGSTNDYKIMYDTQAVKKKIGDDIRKEIQELKDIFKSKGKKKQKEAELTKDEYFDWP